MPAFHEIPETRRHDPITTLKDFSQEVSRLLAEDECARQNSVPSERQNIEKQFDELCQTYPELAAEYLRALASNYEASREA